jgi:hypothetical protein
MRFHYIETLAQRLQAQPDAVRRLLEGKLKDALTDYAARWRQAQQAASNEACDEGAGRPGAPAKALPASTRAAPLAQLNRYIRGLTPPGNAGGGPGGDETAAPELKSVAGFREAWSRIRAEDQVDQAVGRGPENAGPLNSHMLVLRSLALMRSLSPDYLRRFLLQMDALLWLDQASRPGKPTAARPARRGRQGR